MNIGYVLALIAMVAWGLVVIPVKNARTPSSVGIGISMPTGVLALLLAMVYFQDDYSWINGLTFTTVMLLLLEGIFQFALATYFYYESIKYAELSQVIPLTRLKLVIVAAIVFIFSIEAISLKVLCGCAMGIAGAIILTMKTKSDNHQMRTNMKKGIVFALLACFCWALGDVFVKLLIGKVPALPTVFISLALGTAVYYLTMLCSGKIGLLSAVPRRDILLFASHGLLSFVLAYLAFFASMKYIGITRAVVITSTWPLISCLVGFIFYREKITLRKIVGSILLIGSVLIVIEY